MAELNARVLHKRDTSANWTSNNPIILNGEIIVVDTTSGETRTKTGDGSKTYTQLPFDDEVVRSLIDDKISSTQDISNAGKVLGINDDGEVIPVTAISAGSTITWGDISGVIN